MDISQKAVVGPPKSEGASVAHRYLATRVIHQAFRDVDNPNELPTNRASARTFLAGSVMLSRWCEVAQLDPRRVTTRALSLLNW